MKAPAVFFSVSNISPVEKTKCQNKAKTKRGTLLMLRRFFYVGQLYKVRVGLSPHCHSIRRSTCLLTQARPKRAQISIPPLKKDKDTGVITENTAPKAVADRMPKLGQIAARRTANRTRARIVTSAQIYSYLALNWQRAAIEVRHTSRDRRFPTPQPTTRHLFWPNRPRSATLLPPNWLRNPGPAAGAIVALLLPGNETSDFASASVPIGPLRGRGGSPVRVRHSPATGKVAWNFLNKWPSLLCSIRKTLPEAQFIKDRMLEGCSTVQVPI